MQIDEKSKREIKVTHTSDRVAVLATELADILSNIQGEEEDLKAYTADKRAKIESFKAQRQFLVLAIHRGYDLVTKEVTLRKDFEDNSVTIIILETGEILEKRAMTVEERQLFFNNMRADGTQEDAFSGRIFEEGGSGDED